MEEEYEEAFEIVSNYKHLINLDKFTFDVRRTKN
jgi:hypothetical protein